MLRFIYFCLQMLSHSQKCELETRWQVWLLSVSVVAFHLFSAFYSTQRTQKDRHPANDGNNGGRIQQSATFNYRGAVALEKGKCWCFGRSSVAALFRFDRMGRWKPRHYTIGLEIANRAISPDLMVDVPGQCACMFMFIAGTHLDRQVLL